MNREKNSLDKLITKNDTSDFNVVVLINRNQLQSDNASNNMP